jgi:hypothetical protein
MKMCCKCEGPIEAPVFPAGMDELCLWCSDDAPANCVADLTREELALIVDRVLSIVCPVDTASRARGDEVGRVLAALGEDLVATWCKTFCTTPVRGEIEDTTGRWEVSVPDLDHPGEFDASDVMSYGEALSLAKVWGADNRGRVRILNKVFDDDEGARCAEVDETVTCKLCKRPTLAATAHLHEGEYVGDDCCWDERLRGSE